MVVVPDKFGIGGRTRDLVFFGVCYSVGLSGWPRASRNRS